MALVNLLDDRNQFTKSCFAPAAWAAPREVPVEDSLCQYVVDSGEPVLIRDAGADPRVSSSSFVVEHGVRSYLGVPLLTPQGAAIGSLCVADFVPRNWSDEQVDTLREIAVCLATEMQLLRDLREIERLAAALEASREEERAAREVAEAANQAKAALLSRMSHELRTPLNAILGFAQLLEMEVQTEDDGESVVQILRAGHQLLAMIDEVLDIATLGAGATGLPTEPVPVGRLVEESLGQVRHTAAEQGVTLRAERIPADRYVWADEPRLRQVLLDLLSNAIQYNRPGGEVVVSCDDAPDGRLRLSVRDTGIGLTAEMAARLFTPFDRLGAERHGVEGTGLGLTRCKAIVEAMSGTIGVESVPGEGSTFWVELPSVRPDLAGADPERPGGENGQATRS